MQPTFLPESRIKTDYLCRTAPARLALYNYRVLIHGDGHRNWKNAKTVIVTLRLIEARRPANQAGEDGEESEDRFIPLTKNSPFTEHIYAAGTGGESHADQMRYCERIRAMVTAVTRGGDDPGPGTVMASVWYKAL